MGIAEKNCIDGLNSIMKSLDGEKYDQIKEKYVRNLAVLIASQWENFTDNEKNIIHEKINSINSATNLIKDTKESEIAQKLEIPKYMRKLLDVRNICSKILKDLYQ